MNTFWKTIGLYNSSTWLFQAIIILIGIILTVTLLRKPHQWIKTAMKIYFIFIYLWISIVYYFIYCAERSYNEIMGIFWAIMVLAWVWDLIAGYTTFERNSKYNWFGYLLLLLTLLYPVFSLLRGLHYPEITSPLMPCSVVTFTVGLLLLYSRKVNIFIILLLCHWSLIGLTKTFFFDIPEDFILAGASVPALYLFFREYFLSDLHKDTKPKAAYINGLLVFTCVLIGIVLFSTIFFEIYYDM